MKAASNGGYCLSQVEGEMKKSVIYHWFIVIIVLADGKTKLTA